MNSNKGNDTLENYSIGEKVWVWYLNDWMLGIVTDKGNKRIKIDNLGRGVEGFYSLHHVKKLTD
jgi:hypothetical protein